MEKLIDKMAAMPLFNGCIREEIANLLATAPHRVRKKEKGEIIAYAGDELNDVMLLFEGTIYTTMSHPKGNQVVIETLHSPSVLAPAFVYISENRLPVNIVAKNDCQLVYINRNAFAELLHSDKQLMMNFISIISDRLQRLSKRVKEFALLSLRERVLEYLSKNRKIDNVEWLARILGVSRPSLSRVLSELKREGIIGRTIDGLELL